MDFFGEKRSRRRATWVLIIGFMVTMLGTGLLINAGTYVVYRLLAYFGWHSPQVLASGWVSTLLIWCLVLAGAFFRWLDFRHGGAAIALRLKAHQVLYTSTEPGEKICLDIVSEMAIASRQTPPSVWCLPKEHAINAMIVGNSNDYALIVTAGALQSLDKQQLQGVVAHELAHMKHGDVPINMRLVIALGGLLGIYETGLILLKFPIGVVAGGILCGIGSFGVVGGMILRAAISRQREFQADAGAVQFTRDPEGLARALDAIIGHRHGDRYTMVRAPEFVHLSFSYEPDLHRPWFLKARVLDTHPPIDDRIREIDPKYYHRQPGKSTTAVADLPVRPRQKPSVRPNNVSDIVSYLSASGVAFDAEFGDDVTVFGEQNLGSSGLSDRFELLVADQMTGLATLLALFASNETDNRREYIEAIGFAFNRSLAEQVESMREQLLAELKLKPMQTIDYCVNKLSMLDKDKKLKFLKNLEKLIEAEHDAGLRNFVLLRMLRHSMDCEFPVLEKTVNGSEFGQASKSKLKRFNEISEELALVLALIIESSGQSSEQCDLNYSAALQSYTLKHIPRRSCKDKGTIAALEDALAHIQAQPHSYRDNFFNHCNELVVADDKVEPMEKLIVDFLRVSMDNYSKLPKAA